jgi:hypothetical protein
LELAYSRDVWADVLAEAGVTVETVDADHVRLRSDVGDSVLHLRRIDHQIYPSQVPVPPDKPALLAVPAATAGTVEAASRLGWSVVTDDGTLRLRLGDRDLRRDKRVVGDRTRSGRPGPTPWATFTLTRRLLAGAPATQVELAEWTGVSQSKVSRALGRLAAVTLVQRGPSGWLPTDFETLLDWWLAQYPGPGGVTSYWYSLDDPATQAQKALEVLGDQAVVSGDSAADALAPWRRPSTCTVYIHAGASLTRAGFVPVASAAEATLTLCAPKDPGIWLPRTWIAAGLPLADPVQVVYDVATGRGTDRDEAAAHLRAALRTTIKARWHAAVTGRPA